MIKVLLMFFLPVLGIQGASGMFRAAEEVPVLDNIERYDLFYVIGSGQITITNTITIDDADDITLRSATIRISRGYAFFEDELSFEKSDRISGSWNSFTGVLTLTGRATLASYQSALRNVKYRNKSSFFPSTATRTISFTVNDGDDDGNTLTRDIVMSSATAPPRLAGIETSPLIYCSGSEAETISSTIMVTDDDNKELTGATIQILGGYTPNEDFIRFTDQNGISGSWDVSTGAYKLSGLTTITNYQTALRSIRFENTNANASAGERVISFVVDDGYSASNFLTRIITMNGPVSATISGNASICENSTTPLNVVLTGNAPWKYSYKRNAGSPVVIENVLTSPDILQVSTAGTYTLAEVYDKYCKGMVSGNAFVTVTPAPDVNISGLAPAYNKQSTEWIPITGSPAGGTFTGPGIIPYGNVWYFIPSLPPVGSHNIVYTYSALPGTCFGYDTAVVRILENSASIEFENSRKNFCINDPPFKVTGVNLSGATGRFTIEGGIGLVDHHNNTATIYPSMLAIDQYSVTYTYFDETQFSVSSDFHLGDKPKADFLWESECFQAGRSVVLKNASGSYFGNLTDTSFLWKINNSTGYEQFTTRDVTYLFERTGIHNIELKVENSYGCTSSIIKEFALRPTLILTEEGYYEDFESQPISWRSGKSGETNFNSWKLDNPEKGFAGAYSGEYCWYTYIAGSTAPIEQSWITSPCFNFTGMERPMLKFYIWRMFTDTRDGATLQARAGGGKPWISIGKIDDGVNWFNEYTINSKPGDQSVGWSNKKDAGWIEARHSLDILKDNKEVQFRIAYGSTGTAIGNDGFAFDDFRIGERNRISLIEHFTNSSDDEAAGADSVLNKFTNDNLLNVIDLQYHTSSPPGDPLYMDNQVVPSARELYYGLAGVPYSILNGGASAQHIFDYDEKLLNTNMILVESLRESKFAININSKILGNTLYTTVAISPRVKLPSLELTIRLAVIENSITGVSGSNGETTFENVVKTMLPDAAGTTLFKAWNPGELPFSVDHSWIIKNVYDVSRLRLVAFIQSESTREIYDAVLDTIGIITGTDDQMLLSPVERPFIVYPNPSRDVTWISFNRKTEEDMILELYNNLGGIIYTKQIQAGTEITEIPLHDYPGGIYMFRLMNKEKLIGTGKLTISR